MVMNLALVFLVLFALLLQNAEAANCTTLSHSFEAKLNNTCASVVDYSFYVPDGVTLDDLAAMANSQLNNTNLKTFPPLCQQAVRDLVCSNVYLKCYPGIDLALRGTYNFHIYPNMATPPAANSRFPVPFVRPCESTCKNVKLQCAGLYHVGHSFPHCNGTFDYSYGAYTGIDPVPRQYDNDTTQCFKVANVSVASNSEVYQYRHGGVCAGIVDQIFVPPGSAVQPYYSVLQEPYAVQRVIEETLATRTSVLPGWLQSECRLAMLRYICGSAYLVPQGILFNSRLRAAGIPATFAPTLERNYPGLWNYTMILPSFPSLKTCTDYGKTCATFLAFANNSNIEPDCDAESPLIPGVKKFPNATQLLVRQYAQALNVYVSFYTDPHNMTYYNTSEYSYTPSCPYGYVYPEHPNSSHTQYVGVTGCALACRPRVWTDKEWKFLDDRASQLPAAGLVLSVLLMLTFYFRLNELRSNYLMMLFTVLAFVVSAASVALHQKTPEEAYCYDNSINTMQEVDSSSTCVVQGVIIVYTFLALCGIVFMMILDVYIKMKDWMSWYNSRYWVVFQLCFVLLLPIISTAYAGSGDMIGFFRSQPVCFIMTTPYAPKWIDLALVAIPVLIVSLLALVVFLAVLCGMNCCEEGTVSTRIYAGDYNEEDDMYESRPRVRPGYQVQQQNMAGAAAASAEDEGGNLNKKMIFVPDVVFVGLMLIVFLVYCFTRAEYHKQRDHQFENFVEWTRCIFRNYNGDNDHANSVCGEAFKSRPKVNGTGWQVFSLTATSIVVGVVYLVHFVWKMIFGPTAPPKVESDKTKETAPVAPVVAPVRVASPRTSDAKYELVPVQSASSSHVNPHGHVQMV